MVNFQRNLCVYALLILLSVTIFNACKDKNPPTYSDFEAKIPDDIYISIDGFNLSEFNAIPLDVTFTPEDAEQPFLIKSEYEKYFTYQNGLLVMTTRPLEDALVTMQIMTMDSLVTSNPVQFYLRANPDNAVVVTDFNLPDTIRVETNSFATLSVDAILPENTTTSSFFFGVSEGADIAYLSKYTNNSVRINANAHEGSSVILVKANDLKATAKTCVVVVEKPFVNVDDFEFIPDAVTLFPDEPQRVEVAAFLPEDATKKAVKFTCDSELIKLSDMNETSVTLTATAESVDKTYNIIATSVDGNKIKELSVMVLKDKSQVVKLQSFDFPSELTLEVGQSIEAKITFDPPQATNRSLNFELNNANITAEPKNTTTRTIVAKKLGKTTITVTSLDNPSLKKTCVVTTTFPKILLGEYDGSVIETGANPQYIKTPLPQTIVVSANGIRTPETRYAYSQMGTNNIFIPASDHKINSLEYLGNDKYRIDLQTSNIAVQVQTGAGIGSGTYNGTLKLNGTFTISGKYINAEIAYNVVEKNLPIVGDVNVSELFTGKKEK